MPNEYGHMINKEIESLTSTPDSVETIDTLYVAQLALEGLMKIFPCRTNP